MTTAIFAAGGAVPAPCPLISPDTHPRLVDGATEATALLLDIRRHMTPAQMVAHVARHETDGAAFLLALCTIVWRAGHRDELIKDRLAEADDEVGTVEQEFGTAVSILRDRLADVRAVVTTEPDLFDEV